MADEEDIKVNSQYGTPEQIKRAQEYAYGLLRNTEKPVTHWTGGLAHILDAIQGQNILNKTTQQTHRLNQQYGEAAVKPLGLPQQPHQPLTGVEGYPGAPPIPMPNVPTHQEVMQKVQSMKASGAPDIIVNRYLDSVEKSIQPFAHKSPFGDITVNPRLNTQVLQPQEKEFEGISGKKTLRYGTQPSEIPVPGLAPNLKQNLSSSQNTVGSSDKSPLSIKSPEHGQFLMDHVKETGVPAYVKMKDGIYKLMPDGKAEKVK